jgi:anti-sigma regulatory factor (Ser/Thr protein kinase)
MPPPPSTDAVLLRARAARAHAAGLCDRARLACERAEYVSDSLVQTLIAVGASRPPAGGDAFSLRLGRVPSAVQLVRHRLQRWLEGGGMDRDDATDIALACSEACANAVEHPVRAARQRFEVDATRTRDEVTLRVRDFGGWSPHRNEGYPRGRGLAIIRRLMDEAEVVRTEGGTTLVMRRALDSERCRA